MAMGFNNYDQELLNQFNRLELDSIYDKYNGYYSPQVNNNNYTKVKITYIKDYKLVAIFVKNKR